MISLWVNRWSWEGWRPVPDFSCDLSSWVWYSSLDWLDKSSLVKQNLKVEVVCEYQDTLHMMSEVKIVWNKCVQLKHSLRVLWLECLHAQVSSSVQFRIRSATRALKTSRVSSTKCSASGVRIVAFRSALVSAWNSKVSLWLVFNYIFIVHCLREKHS